MVIAKGHEILVWKHVIYIMGISTFTFTQLNAWNSTLMITVDMSCISQNSYFTSSTYCV